ncbi:MAG: hypothetical protein JWO44_33 [Bacteroidetes bacterium]|nr:hypothetical protein [Bacteroidota bacterium]
MKKTIVIAFAMLAGISGFSQAKKVKSPIDGRIYTMTLTPEGEKKAEPVKDEGSFVLGKFKSTFLMQAGFTQSDYEYEVDSTSGAQVIKFTVEAKNENQERFSWDASIEGDKITGTAIIRKKGKIQHTYTISGTWKNKKKPKPQPKTPVAPATPPDSTKTEQ